MDGQFELALRDENLLFRGSSNQRLIDVQKSLAKGEGDTNGAVLGVQGYIVTEEISKSYNIPIRVTKLVINKLLDSGIIIETLNEDERVPSYQPAFDISNLSVGMLLNKIDTEGAGEKSFRVNRNDKYKLQWDTVMAAQEGVYNATNNILIKSI